MRQRLVARDLGVEELLGGAFEFAIPAYQRDFSWTREEAGQLIDDLSAVIEDVERDGARTPYFIGTMLLVEAKDGEGRVRHVEVVDGQQRLVTLTILFSVLRDMAEEDEAAALDTLVAVTRGSLRVPRLVVRSADEGFFRDAIQTQGATRRSQTAQSIGSSAARRNIEDVRRALRTKMQREFSIAERRRLAAFVREHARVLAVISDDFDYAYQIFLTINDRGKRLSVEDIFRGEILGPLDREQRLRYEAIIDEMDKYREAAEATRTKGKTFFSHLATIDGWPRRGIIEGLKQAVARRGGPRRFVDEMFAPMAEAYLRIKEADAALPLGQPASDLLTALSWLEMHGDDDWVPIAMVGLDRLQGEPERLNAFLRHLDRYAHALMMLGCGREARRRHYAPMLQTMLDRGQMPDPAVLFQLTARNQKIVLRNAATRLHIVDPPTARLVLARADLAVSGRPFSWYAPLLKRDRRSLDCFTVEHVCPKGELASGDWLRLYPKQATRQRAAECIGNLALVTARQNKECNQHDFTRKRELLFNGGEAAPFQLTDMVRHEADWDSLAIARRYVLIMTAIKEMWSLQGPIPQCPALGRSPVPRPGPDA